jgi:hypothetical protein
VIALLLACADVPVVEPAAMMADEPVTVDEAEPVVVELEALPIVPETETEPEPADEPTVLVETEAAVVWYDSLPPEEQIIVGLVGEAVDRTVDELVEHNRIRPSAVPWIGWARDTLKLIFGLGIAVLLARTRRPTVDAEAIAEQAADRILGRADVVARESEVGRLAELDRLRIAHAEAQSEIARLRQRPDTSPALPGLEDPEARRLAVEEAGRAALRRRR